LWSLAVIVFQCVTGRLPFESEALGDLLVKIIVNPVPMMSQVAEGVPRELDEWWRVAAERSPEKRFQTAKQFAEELNKAISSVGNITQMTSAQSNQKIPQGTAVMQHGTPPGLQGQQYTQAMQTPPGPQQRPFMQTPQPYMNTPHPGQPGAYPPNATTGSGLAAFSESQNIPKKGPPMVLLAAFAALAIVGIVGGGLAWKMRSSAAGSATAASSTAAPPPETPTVPPPPSATATEPPPAETAAKPPEKPADPTPPAATTTTVAVKLSPQPPPYKPPPPPSKPPAQPPAKKPPEKPLNLGF
jgi:serine/threonine-protein kinase